MVAAIVGNYLGTGSHLFDTREFTLGSCLISTVRLGKPSPTNINLSSTRKSTVEKELMSVVDVGNSFWMAPCLLFIHQRVHTGERSFKCSRVENSLVAAHSLDIGHKGLMSTSNVGNFCGTTTDSLHTSQFMLLWHLMRKANMGMSLHTTLASLNIVEFVLKKCLLRAVNVGAFLVKTPVHLAPKSSHQRKNLWVQQMEKDFIQSLLWLALSSTVMYLWVFFFLLC